MLYRHPNGTIAPLPRTLATAEGEMLNFHLVADPENYDFWAWSEELPESFDTATHKAVPRETEDGEARTARRVWDIIPLTPEEIEANCPPVPDEISDRQFAQQLAILGTITQAEAIAWAARGDLPDVLETAIGSLPDDGTRFSAQMLLSSATTYERSHPMTATLGAMLGYDDADLDAMWRAAALL